MKKNSALDAENFEHLFKEHYPFLCLVSFAILKDRDASKDVVQDFFVDYWQRRKSITIRTSFRAYAIRAVKNLSLLAVKNGTRERDLISRLEIQPYELQNFPEKDKRHSRIYEALKKLPAKRREIFIASVVEGNSYSEIAHASGISINTVKTQIKRSYAFLRAQMREDILTFVIFCSLLLFLTGSF